jgi:hypothetical protein
VHVPLAGARRLRLETRTAGDGDIGDRASWQHARVIAQPKDGR